MNRKRGLLSSAGGMPRLQSFAEFCASVPPLEGELGIASVLDLYCVLSQLHAKGVVASLQAGRKFHYFVTSKGVSWGEQESSQQILVPMGSKCSIVSLTLIQTMFTELNKMDLEYVDLALVDGDGSMTTHRLYDHIRPPPEGVRKKRKLESTDQQQRRGGQSSTTASPV